MREGGTRPLKSVPSERTRSLMDQPTNDGDKTVVAFDINRAGIKKKSSESYPAKRNLELYSEANKQSIGEQIQSYLEKKRAAGINIQLEAPQIIACLQQLESALEEIVQERRTNVEVKTETGGEQSVRWRNTLLELSRNAALKRYIPDEVNINTGHMSFSQQPFSELLAFVQSLRMNLKFELYDKTDKPIIIPAQQDREAA